MENTDMAHKLDILLIAPPYEDTYGFMDIKTMGWYNPPLGLTYIQSFIKKHGFKSKTIDMICLSNPWEKICEIIAKFKPKYIGISCTTPMIPKAEKISKIAKGVDKNIKIILGGSHPTAMVQETIGYPWVDFVVFGEGEQTVLELLQDKNHEDIAGLAFKKNNNVVINKKRALIKNLDELPFPDVSDLPMEKYTSPWLGRATNIQMSRGCPYNCTFCASILVWDRKYRVRSVKNVIAEIKSYIDNYGITNFLFNDDTFTVSKKITLDFCKEIQRAKLKINWDCLTRLDCVDEELLTAMKKAGCKVIRYGIEYGSQKQLDSMNKQLEKDKLYDKLKLTQKAGIQTYGFFIIGQPYSTEQDLMDTIEFARSLPLDYAQFAMIVPLPGTKIWYDCLQKKGISLVTSDWSRFCFHNLPVVELPGIKPERILYFYRLAYKRFYFHFSFIVKRGLSSCFSGQILRDIKAFVAFLILTNRKDRLIKGE